MKVCTACKQQKHEDEFAWKSKATGKRQSRCKPCYREYNRSYYQAGEKEKQIKRVVENKKIIYNKYKEWKKDKSCLCCGEDAPECLELHHTDPSTKDGHPSTMISRGWKKFLEEAAKCEVLCSNCHKKVHSGRITLPAPPTVF